MNIPVFVLLIFMTLGTDAGEALQSNDSLILPSNNQIIIIEVDRSTITKDSLIRLKLDVQFEESGGIVPRELMPEDLRQNLESPLEEEKSGYLITIKLPIAETWREKGKSLKIKISADTVLSDQPTIGLESDSE